MKTIKGLTIILVVLSALLTGCKSAQPKTATEENAYPVGESYPLEGYPIYDYGTDYNTSYPVYPIDATQLTKVPAWALTRYSVNGQEEAHDSKTFTFTGFGDYTLTTDSGVEEGQWVVTTTTDVFLVLSNATEQDISYVIVSLTPENMLLTIEQDGALVEKQYQPAD